LTKKLGTPTRSFENMVLYSKWSI